MATVMEHPGTEVNERRMERRAAAGGPVVELIGGAGAIVLAILALVGVLPTMLAAIAFIAIGGGMMMQGGALGVYERHDVRWAPPVEETEMIGGMSAEILGGAATTALGIIALVGLFPLTLMAVASIVAGAALVLGAGTTARLNGYRIGGVEVDERRRSLLRESVNAAAGADVLVGLSAIALGILVLVGVGTHPVQRTLAFVAALALGCALFLNGTTVGARMGALLRH